MNLRRVAVVAAKEWREIVRDPVFLALAFVLPVSWIFIFGYTMVFDIDNVPFAIVDYDHSARSRDLAHRFIDSRYFDFRGYVRSEHEADGLLAASRMRMIVTIPEHFARDIATGKAAKIATTIDGTFPNRAQTIKAYADAITRSFSGTLQARYFSQHFGMPEDRALTLMEPMRLEVRYLYNQGLRSVWSTAPSLVMLTLMFVPCLLTALVVVREKDNGSIFNIYASTITRGEFLAGKMLPSVLISYADALILSAIATAYFGAPFKANPGFYLLACLVYVTCTASIGLLVSTLVRSQNAALMISSIVAIVPAIQFSGMIIPVATLEGGALIQAHLFPAMYFENIVLGSFLKGVGISTLWPDLLVLSAYAIALIALSHWAFRKRQAR